MQRADCITAAEVTFQRLQQSAESLRSTFCERNDSSELGDFALTRADTTGVLCSRRRCELSFELGQTSLERRSAQFGRIGVKLTQLLNLLVDDCIALRFGRCLCLRCHDYSFSFRSLFDLVSGSNC